MTHKEDWKLMARTDVKKPEKDSCLSENGFKCR